MLPSSFITDHCTLNSNSIAYWFIKYRYRYTQSANQNNDSCAPARMIITYRIECHSFESPDPGPHKFQINIIRKTVVVVVVAVIVVVG